MSAVTIPQGEDILRKSRGGVKTRTTLTRAIRGHLFTWLSPFERWDDENYAPRHLHHVSRSTDTTFEVMAELHGFAASEIFVELHRGQVIILFSRPAKETTDTVEYYCEVPIPTDTRADEANVEITPDLLVVRLHKYPVAIRRLIAPVRRWLRGTL